MSANTAIVTGAGRGIGLQICRRLATKGWNVAGLSRDPSALERTAAVIRKLPGRFVPVVGDVRSPSDMSRLPQTAFDRFGSVCAVVVNSGIPGPTAPIESTDLAAWEEVIETNLTGAFLTARAAIPYLKKEAWGRIVFVGSTTGKNAVASRGAYAASKTGLLGLARALAAELGPDHITVNVVCPGVVAGDRWNRVASALAEVDQSTVEQVTSRYLARTLLKRLIDPCEVAESVAFLLSEHSGGITGQDLNICGGMIFN